MTQSPEQLAAELYDISVPDWDGESDFCRELAREAKSRKQSILEVACGTGRVSIRLAEEAVEKGKTSFIRASGTLLANPMPGRANPPRKQRSLSQGGKRSARIIP